jgi:hypothetical protein
MQKLTSLFLVLSLAATTFAVSGLSVDDSRNTDLARIAVEEIITLKQAGLPVTLQLYEQAGLQCGSAQAITRQERTGDSCDDAVQIPTLPYEVSETTSDNSHTYGNYSAPDEWYAFWLPNEGNVLISLCGGGTDYDSYLYLLNDECSTEIASNDDACSTQSELDIFLGPGYYKIGVSGWSSYSGSYLLSVTTDAPMEGNSCEDPILVESLPYNHEWITAGYSDTGHNPSPDVFYQFLLEEEGVYMFTTCMEETYEGYFDTALHLLTEDCATVVHTNDDDCDAAYGGWSTINACLVQGLYYLVVEGSGSDSGSYQLECWYAGSCDPCDPPDCPDWGIDEVEPNDGSNDDPPAYDNIAPGDIHCGSVWSSSYTRDTDWYQFTVAADSEVDFMLDGEEGHALVLYLIDESSGSPEIVATASPQGYCSDYRLTLTVADAGTYSAFVAYDDYYTSGPSSLYTLNWISPEAVNTPVAPHDFSLAQNYPNPFNPATTIEFSLPAASSVQLSVYDVAGHRVAMLADGRYGAGMNRVVFDAADLPSGLYFYLLRVGEYQAARKMILVR